MSLPDEIDRLKSYFLGKKGGVLSGDVKPNTTDVHDLGTSAKRWNIIYAKEVVADTFSGGGGAADHGTLTGLGDDDHLQYVHKDNARTITAQHMFAPGVAQPPFSLAVNAQGQTVTGLQADQLDKLVTAGSGLSGGGALTSNITLNVGAGDGILSNTDTVSVRLAAVSGLSFATGALQIDDSIAGAGLAISSKVLSVGAGSGITVNANDVALNTPGTLSISSTNNSSGNHTHAITSSSNPGAVASLLASDAAGALTLTKLTVSPGTAQAPFVLGANAQGQTVVGLKADQLNQSVIAGNGLTGGGALTADVTLSVGAGNGLTVNADDVALTTPGTLSVSSTNNPAGSHTHAITTSSNPGAGASILASDASGYLTLIRLNTDEISDKSGGSLKLSPTGDITLDPGGNDILPNTNYDLNLGSTTKKYLTVHAAELHVETLVAQDTMATIGGRILIAPTTMLTRDLAAAGTTIYVKHNQMVFGDIVYLENGGNVEWILVTGDWALQPEGDYSYTITRNLEGGPSAHDWSAGDAVVNTGTTGDGYIDIYSKNSIRSGTQYGPTIVGNIRTGTTYSNLVEGWAIGNLNGLYGYSSGDIYGVALGRYLAGSTFITIDPSNGLRFINKTVGGDVINAQWDNSGNILIGQVGASQDNLYISSGGLVIRNNTTERIKLTAAGALTINNSAGSPVFTFDASSGAEFTLPLSMAAAGGIYQGTGSFGTPTTGLKIWNDGGIGRIGGYSSGSLEWYANTDGKMYVGDGKIVMDSKGISIKIPTTKTSDGMIQFVYDTGAPPDTYSGSVFGYGSALSNVAGLEVARGSVSNEAYLVSESTLTYPALTTIRATSGTTHVILSLFSDSDGNKYFRTEGAGITVGASLSTMPVDGDLHAQTDGRFGGGLYVGATNVDPAVGVIEATAHVTAPKLTGSLDGNTGGVFIGSDTQIYRSQINTLTTPDTFKSDVHVSAPILTASGDGASYGVAIGSDTKLYRYAASVIGTANSFRTTGGVSVGSLALAPAGGNLTFTGALGSYKNSTTYTGYIYVPLSTPLTSTSWDGDLKTSTMASTSMDLSAVFGVPAGVKAVVVRVKVYDTTIGAGNYYWAGGPSSTYWYMSVVNTHGGGSGKPDYDTVVINCDANGDIYYQIAASGGTGSATLSVDLQVWGYYI